MKQLPRVSSLLYCQPWAILPQDHAELGGLYRSYLDGNLRVPASAEVLDIAEAGAACSGVRWRADHASGIAVITLEGVISKHAPDTLCGPAIADLAALDELVHELMHDHAINTVVLYLNSPGGSVIGLKESVENLRELAAEKRLVAYTDFQMCSAAYYLAAACDEIYAAPSSCIGSIGTYIAALDDSRAWEMEGLELKLFRVGTLKAIGHPGKSWTPEEEKFLQDTAEAAGADFRNWVTSRRPGVEESTMQGQWFFAADAPAGLVDGFHRDLPRLLAELMVAQDI
jgi:signal peptide peptidase SppA